MSARRPPAKRDLTNLAGLRVGLYGRVSRVDSKGKAEKDDWGGDAKSVHDQEAVGLAWVAKHGCTLAGQYRDSDRSASRFARKEREEYNRLVGDIKAGKLDVLWVWELSRAARRLTVLAELIEDCQEHGVLLVIKDDIHDLSRSSSALILSILGAISQLESEQTSERCRRGLASVAEAGKPHASAPYGYRRIYDEVTKQLLRQEPNVYDDNGHPRERSPAWVVAEIFARIAAGDSVSSIEKDLNRREIPAPRGGPWQHATILYIAKSPTYIGRRVFQADPAAPDTDRLKHVLEGVVTVWPPLVTEETFLACRRVLTDPARPVKRPARARHLLSHLARCAECGSYLDPNLGRDRRRYRCKERFCIQIPLASLDDYVEKVIVGMLSDPAVFADVARMDDSAAAAAARVDAERARVELRQLYQDAEAGDVDPVIATRRSRRLQEEIAAAEQREQAATLPPVLVGNVGPEAKAKWAKLDMAVKRQIIRAVADIRVRRAGSGSHAPVGDRVDITPLLGPGSNGDG